MSTNTSTQTHLKPKTYNTWADVYMEFMEIMDQILETTLDHNAAHVLIEMNVNALYAQHGGDPLWDAAYERWIAPSDDDPYVKEVK